MKLRLHFFLFIIIQTALIYLVIYKKNHKIFLSFKKQKYEREHHLLLIEKDLKTEELMQLQDRALVKKIAQQELKMQKIALNQICHLHEPII